MPADRLLPVPPFPPPRGGRQVRAVGARVWRRSWPWLVAAVVLVLVVVTELGLLRGRIQTDLTRLRDAAGAPSATAAASTPELPAVPLVAPAAAGDVAAVRARLLGPPCAPAGPCTVVVGIDRRSGAPTTPTSWAVLATDRCRATVEPLGDGSTPAAAGAYGIATVQLPAARALAVIVVTGAPSRAASAALPIGAGPC